MPPPPTTTTTTTTSTPNSNSKQLLFIVGLSALALWWLLGSISCTSKKETFIESNHHESSFFAPMLEHVALDIKKAAALGIVGLQEGPIIELQAAKAEALVSPFAIGVQVLTGRWGDSYLAQAVFAPDATTFENFQAQLHGDDSDLMFSEAPGGGFLAKQEVVVAESTAADYYY